MFNKTSLMSTTLIFVALSFYFSYILINHHYLCTIDDKTMTSFTWFTHLVGFPCALGHVRDRKEQYSKEWQWNPKGKDAPAQIHILMNNADNNGWSLCAFNVSDRCSILQFYV